MVWTGEAWGPYATNTVFGGEASSIGAPKGDTESIELHWTAGEDSGSTFWANRERYTRNALGLARLSDIPTNTSQLLNGSGFVTASITNGLASTNYVNAIGTNYFTRAEAEAGYTKWSATVTPYGGDTTSLPLGVVFWDSDYGWTLIADVADVYNIDAMPNLDALDPNVTNLLFTGAGGRVDASRHRITPTKTSQLENDSGFIGDATPSFTAGDRNPSRSVGYGTLSVGTNNAAELIGSAAIGQDVTVRSSRSFGSGRNLSVTNAQAFAWNGTSTPYGSHGVGSFSINPQNGGYGIWMGDRTLYQVLAEWLSATNTTTRTVALDEDDEESSIEMSFAPFGVAKRSELSEYAKTNDVNAISASVGVLWSYVYGQSVWIAVTNYMRTAAGVSPSFQLWEVRNGVTNCVYWSREEITNVTAGLIHDCKTNLEATVAAATNAMPKKSWSSYQSATGAENPQPERITIVSTPAIQMTGGGEWYEYVSTGGSSIWVLRSNGLTNLRGGTNGFFRVEDDEGRAQFEVVNTADVTLDAVPLATGWDGSGNFVATWNWTNNVQPVLYAALNLDDPSVGEENGEINSLGISVSWAKVDGYWAATVQRDTFSPRLFVHAKVAQPGVKAVVHSSPTQLDGGLLINGTQYRIVPYTTGGKTYLTLEAWQ